MASVANSFDTYEAVGNREDLIDLITQITLHETPLFSQYLARVKASGTTHEFQTQALRSRGVNAEVEGNRFAADARTPTVRLSNYTQINSEHVEVTGTQEVVNKAGRGSEYAYQKTIAMKELAGDTEYSILHGTGNSGDSGTARELKGIVSWITTNVDTGTATGAATVLDEDRYNDNLQDVWLSGGRPNVTLADAFNKRQISGFTGGTGSSRNISAESARLVNTVDSYRSDFSEQNVIPHQDLGSNAGKVGSVLQLTTDKWRTAVLRPAFEKQLGQLGDSMVTQIIQELTIESLAEQHSGKITNLTTA